MTTTTKVLIFLLSSIIILTAQICHGKKWLKPDKNGVFQISEDQESIEHAIKTLDSVLVTFYSPKCQSCLEAETELNKVCKDWG